VVVIGRTNLKKSASDKIGKLHDDLAFYVERYERHIFYRLRVRKKQFGQWNAANKMFLWRPIKFRLLIIIFNSILASVCAL